MAGFNIRQIAADVEEIVEPGLSPEKVAENIAATKGRALIDELNEAECLIAADTIVCCGDVILGKPESREEALDTLGMLSGASHHVITGVYLNYKEQEYTFHDLTRVTFQHIPLKAREYYVDEYKPFDKAGSYGIQEWIGLHFIESIEGNYENVVGLPVVRISALLRSLT